MQSWNLSKHTPPRTLFVKKRRLSKRRCLDTQGWQPLHLPSLTALLANNTGEEPGLVRDQCIHNKQSFSMLDMEENNFSYLRTFCPWQLCFIAHSTNPYRADIKMKQRESLRSLRQTLTARPETRQAAYLCTSSTWCTPNDPQPLLLSYSLCLNPQLWW